MQRVTPELLEQYRDQLYVVQGPSKKPHCELTRLRGHWSSDLRIVYLGALGETTVQTGSAGEPLRFNHDEPMILDAKSNSAVESGMVSCLSTLSQPSPHRIN
jgi:hypothetical protein